MLLANDAVHRRLAELSAVPMHGILRHRFGESGVWRAAPTFMAIVADKSGTNAGQPSRRTRRAHSNQRFSNIRKAKAPRDLGRLSNGFAILSNQSRSGDCRKARGGTVESAESRIRAKCPRRQENLGAFFVGQTSFEPQNANALVPVWDCWQELLPTNPLAADVFADGLRRMPRDEALQHANIEFNSDRQIRWLNFDIDQQDAYDALDRANLPAPNIFVQNRGNGHAHALYALDGFIGLTDASRVAPIKLAATVQRGMTRRLGADWRYVNRFAKNPLSERWAASFMAPSPYHLTDLLAALDKLDYRRPPECIDMTGLGRNCDLFDIVRVWAYSRVRDAKGRLTPEQWREAVFAEVALHNLGFGVPLPYSETRQIAKSIAGWTWRKFNGDRFSAIQAQRRAPSAKAQREKTSALINAVEGL